MMISTLKKWAKHNRRWIWALSVIVVFCTTYALILPAITLDKQAAGQQGGIDVTSQQESVNESSTEETLSADGELSFEGDGFSVSAAYDAKAGLPLHTELAVTEISKKDEDYAALRDEALEAVRSADGGSAEDELEFARFYDISLTADGVPVEPEAPVDVAISYEKALHVSDAQNLRIVHFGEKGIEVLDPDDVVLDLHKDTMSEAAFPADSFSIYALVYTMTSTVISSSGETYEITVSYGDDAGIPEGAKLEAAELTGDEYDDYVVRTAEAMDAGGFDYARIFDISIVDEAGEKIQPDDEVKVSVRLLDGEVSSDEISVVHFSGEAEEPRRLDTETGENAVTFNTDSFSAYAIVQGPEEPASDWIRISSAEDLDKYISSGFYIGTTGGYFLQNTTALGTLDNRTTGIVKTKPAQTEPPMDSAALYYFESSGTDGYYYIYCLDANGSKQYVRNTGDQNLTLTADDTKKTAFRVLIDKNGKFRFNNGNRYWNMWNGANGNHIAAYTNATDGNNYFYVWKYDEMEDDPYDLDGKTYGLMNWVSGTTGKAMMASSEGDHLEGLALSVMSKTDNSSTLYVPADSDISMWTFENIGRDNYYLTAEVDGVRNYLQITSEGVSLVTEPNDDCKIKVVAGTGSYSGQICLKAGNTVLTYSGNIDTGFSVGGSAGSEWLHLVEESELTDDYFMTYSARKVSVSDPAVTNGSRIIVYTRVWNETKKKYEFYAVDHDGSLVPCYESGDSIEWSGRKLNSMLWNFVEYYKDGTTEPSFYYELYNQYSEKYIAPQISDGQILSDDTIGINLNGRKNGEYYSTILAWDDDNYSYAGLKADVETGQIVSCPKSEADDFYFAIMQDIPVDDELTTVPTVDHQQYGITMKMVNFKDRAAMSSFLGSDNGYKNGNTEANLLSTELGEDGYPTTKANNSLSDWFADADEVNHLFVESTYNATGYYEYDSVQNFAHLDQTTNDFVVYKQIGTTDTASGKFYTHGQFFPYNDLEAGVFSTQKNLTDALGNTLPDSDPRKYEQLYHIQNPANPDYYLGVELEASFTQTPNGLDDWGHDIIYEFTGDDDFWLYVDGERIIDLGGIHDALPGSVNYRTGEVVVNGTHTTLKDLFYNNYKSRGHTDAEAQAYVDDIFTQNEEGNWVFKDYTTHTMKIFYLERGAGASNLHMRFNLASIKPGTVQLSKKLSGVDSSESVYAEFPYQIKYRTKSGGDTEFYLTNSIPQSTQTEDYVYYKGSQNPVTYEQSLEVGGVAYNDVFLLKPGEIAEINFPEDVKDYRIIECGVDTDTYEKVSANDHEISGTSGAGYADNRKDYGIDYTSTDDRGRVVYDNKAKSGALRDLTITKKLYDEIGTTEIVDDSTMFNFRLYFSTEFGELEPADMHTYHVKDPDGNYCRWNVSEQKFVSLDKKDYDQLTDEEKEQATFITSMNGSISKIHAGYTVEVRNVLAGTKFKLVERPTEMPDGYAFQKYEYGEQKETDAWTGMTGTVSAEIHPHVDVCNLKGWGLRVNKVWTDADYMSDRDPTYFAVYTGTTEEDLQMVAGTLRQMKYGENTLYWYFLPLPVDVPFDSYEIREVTIENPEPTVDEEGRVSDPGTVTPVPDGETVTISGTQKGETSASDISYTVNYDKGAVSQDSNVREDTVTNSRPGIVLKKEDWSENPLPGAVFELSDEDGNPIGTFTSDSGGLITTAFLRENVEYSLTETKAPRPYHGLESSITIKIDPTNGVTVSGADEDKDYYDLQQPVGGIPTLTIKDRPYTFEAVKIDGDTKDKLSGVTFSLYKQYKVEGNINFEKVVGYETLETDSDGIIPGIDNTLPAGVYQLRETRSLSGYAPLSVYIQFVISPTGKISRAAEAAQNAEITETIKDDGSLSYTLTISNHQVRSVSVWKTDMGYNALTGAAFALYKAEDYDDSSESPKSGAVPVVTGSVNDKGLLVLGPLETGEYRLKETQVPEAYNKPDSAVRIFVAPQGVTAIQSGNQSEVYDKDSEHWVSGQDEANQQIRVWNSSGTELPSTGGPGTMLSYMFGGALILLAGALLFRRRRAS